MTGATITWRTNEASSAQVKYGTTTAYGLESPPDTTPDGIAHTIDLNGLAPNTTYHFQVLSRDAKNNLAPSGDGFFKTLDVPDTKPPIISGITVSGRTATGAIITWTTNEKASSQVNYGATAAYGSTSNGTSFVTSHSLTLSGLSPETSYHFQVRSRDAADNAAAPSTDRAFTTTASSGLLVTNLNRLSYKVVNNGLSNGALIYIDRLFTFEGVPASLSGATYIKTGNGDKSSTGSPFLTFNVSEGVTVYIAHDDRISVKPSWLSVFIDTGDDVIIAGTPHSLFKKVFSAGPVLLGGNEGGGNNSMYAVIFGAASTDPADTTPPVLTDIKTVLITETEAKITWTSDEAATSRIEFGIDTFYGSTTSLSASPVTSHSQTLVGLIPSKTYHYRVVSVDTSGNERKSGDFSFTTKAVVVTPTDPTDTTPPVLTDIKTVLITETEAKITWTSDEAATSRIEFGIDPSYGDTTALATSFLTSHSRTITGLIPSKTYHYRVVSMDTSGNVEKSGDFSFTTQAVVVTPTDPTDTTPPVLTDIKIVLITETEAKVTWTSDEAATSRIEFGIDPSYGDTTALATSFLTSHSRTITGLSPSKTYHYRVVSMDTFGNEGKSGDFSFTTQAVVVTPTPGPVLSLISAVDVTDRSAKIVWGTDKLATTQVSFGETEAYGRSTTNLTLSMGHAQILSGLKAETTYHYQVISADASGKQSFSGNRTFTTEASSAGAPVDTTPPSDVSNFSVSSGLRKLILTWTNPLDADFRGVRIYYRTDGPPTNLEDAIFLGDFIGAPGQPMSGTHVGLKNNLTYFYAAASFDLQGNFQNTKHAKAKTFSPVSNKAVSEDEPFSSGGCGMIKPGDGGDPPGPGQAAAMIGMLGVILFMLLKKTVRNSQIQTVKI